MKKMTTIIKKIYTIARLLTNIIVRRRRYVLSFTAESDGPVKRWYYDFRHWGFAHGNLEMVAGADMLCESFSSDSMHTRVEVLAASKELDKNMTVGFTKFAGEKLVYSPSPNAKWWERLLDKYLWGRTYTFFDEQTGKNSTMWICPVTLFVLGRYPNYLYVRKTS